MSQLGLSASSATVGDTLYWTIDIPGKFRFVYLITDSQSIVYSLHVYSLHIKTILNAIKNATGTSVIFSYKYQLRGR